MSLFSAASVNIGKARSFADLEAENEILLLQAFYINLIILDCINSGNICTSKRVIGQRHLIFWYETGGEIWFVLYMMTLSSVFRSGRYNRIIPIPICTFPFRSKTIYLMTEKLRFNRQQFLLYFSFLNISFCNFFTELCDCVLVIRFGICVRY